MMIRTQISVDIARADALDEVSSDEVEDRSVVIRAAVDRLVRLSGTTAADALLAWSDEFATPLGGDVAERHDEIVGDLGW